MSYDTNFPLWQELLEFAFYAESAQSFLLKENAESLAHFSRCESKTCSFLNLSTNITTLSGRREVFRGEQVLLYFPQDHASFCSAANFASLALSVLARKC